MAINMISEAPRISLSDNLCYKDGATTIEDFQNQSNSNPDFDFCISNSSHTETCSANELFLDGLTRPFQLQEKPLSKTRILASPPNQLISYLKQNVTTTSVHQSKSFWRIRRSTSVNNHTKSSFWSLPLLSGSNSTGSVVPNSKNSTKEGHRLNAQFKQIHPSSASFYTFPSSKKPPLRKNYGSGPNYGNGIRINLVLNVPSNFIPKGTANLFGLGSFFANGKEKKCRK